ncbi:MAG: phosphotransferase [Candidatus Lokiarchaeota archaeon]|nr:phosphotransferase [Candidatus Lokiarchaeota archaeon]MBD3338241.1 phosphotransferase [Candidatus Lokiarchaeota archaeon]
MSYEETNPQDINTKKVLKLLKPIFPDIKKSDVQFFYHGTYNLFIVKKDYIFRFPDRSFYNEKGYDLISREVVFLDTIRDLISFQIPKPLFVSEDETNPFMGYKKISGTSLSRCYDKTTGEEQEQIGEELARFLSEYHSKKVFKIIKEKFYREVDTSIKEYQRSWQEYREKMESLVYPRLTREEKDWVRKLFDAFLENEENFDFTPTVIHGDLDTSNILVNPKNYQITGIIDFEEARIGDPACDLIFIDEGEVFCDALFRNYKGQIDPGLKTRRKFYFCRTGIIYIHVGVELSYPRMIEHGHELLQKQMKFSNLNYC